MDTTKIPEEVSIHDVLAMNVISEAKRRVDEKTIRTLEKLESTLKTDQEREFFYSLVRKYSLSVQCKEKILELTKKVCMQDAVKVEFFLYSGLFFCTACLDSLSCLINSRKEMNIDEKRCGFNNKNFRRKLPKEIKETVTLKSKEITEMYTYRNAVAHRQTTFVLPAGRGPEDLDNFLTLSSGKHKLSALINPDTRLIRVNELYPKFVGLCRMLISNIAPLL